MDPVITEEYATYQDAIVYFMKRCNIMGADQYFPFLRKSGIEQKELGFFDE
jgi:hypothetical protein